MRSTVCMLVEIPEGTVDDDTLEEMLRAAIEDYSVELAKRIKLCIDSPDDDCDACNGMEEDEDEDEDDEDDEDDEYDEEEEDEEEEYDEEEEDEEEEYDEEEDQDELYERRLVLCADGIRPDEAQTVVALIGQVVENSRFGIAGTVLDDCYDEESAESSENDEDEDEDWDIRDII
ncbi:MAG: hypothetical protein PHO92_00955 [Candidatus Peribacteraceae bacterium]|nr:hypothetical protein [Candidatus Peribacteraceae bacterium]